MHAGRSNWPENRGDMARLHPSIVQTKLFLVCRYVVVSWDYTYTLNLLYKGNRTFFISAFSF
jgi:hypothetical protein